MLAHDALAQNKSVLRADGHYQSQAGGKAGKYVMHVLEVLYLWGWGQPPFS
jgi:hypothetical protein